MANSFFQFKQFTIRQENCAMKVGTDGVLLGAWASIERAENILDIGTGTGLIALMLSQRCNAFVDAIDIDRDAYMQACQNIRQSPFCNQIRVYHSPLADFVTSTTKKYDLVVSNPPYFNRSLRGPDEKRNKARHTESLSLEELIKGSKQLVSPQGCIAVILPFDQKERLNAIIFDNQLYIKRQTTIYSKVDSPPKRILTEISITPVLVIEDNLVIEINRHQYTSEYISLTKEFYLKM